jgi:hypothetical protein
MNRRLSFLVVVLLLAAANVAAIDPQTLARARRSMDDLNRISTDIAQETQRDAEILRHLRAASRGLDDWQKNVAVSKAADSISKAVQLAARSSQRVKQAVQVAQEIIGPAKASPNGADLVKLRAELHARPIEQMRLVVAEEMDVLARISTQVADIASILTKAVADASSSTLGGGD